jgi:hypothetical protein
MASRVPHGRAAGIALASAASAPASNALSVFLTHYNQIISLYKSAIQGGSPATVSKHTEVLEQINAHHQQMIGIFDDARRALDAIPGGSTIPSVFIKGHPYQITHDGLRRMVSRVDEILAQMKRDIIYMTLRSGQRFGTNAASLPKRPAFSSILRHSDTKDVASAIFNDEIIDEFGMLNPDELVNDFFCNGFTVAADGSYLPNEVNFLTLFMADQDSLGNLCANLHKFIANAISAINVNRPNGFHVSIAIFASVAADSLDENILRAFSAPSVSTSTSYATVTSGSAMGAAIHPTSMGSLVADRHTFTIDEHAKSHTNVYRINNNVTIYTFSDINPHHVGVLCDLEDRVNMHARVFDPLNEMAQSNINVYAGILDVRTNEDDIDSTYCNSILGKYYDERITPDISDRIHYGFSLRLDGKEFNANDPVFHPTFISIPRQVVDVDVDDDVDGTVLYDSPLTASLPAGSGSIGIAPRTLPVARLHARAGGSVRKSSLSPTLESVFAPAPTSRESREIVYVNMSNMTTEKVTSVVLQIYSRLRTIGIGESHHSASSASISARSLNEVDIIQTISNFMTVYFNKFEAIQKLMAAYISVAMYVSYGVEFVPTKHAYAFKYVDTAYPTCITDSILTSFACMERTVPLLYQILNSEFRTFYHLYFASRKTTISRNGIDYAARHLIIDRIPSTLEEYCMEKPTNTYDPNSHLDVVADIFTALFEAEYGSMMNFDPTNRANRQIIHTKFTQYNKLNLRAQRAINDAVDAIDSASIIDGASVISTDRS